MQLSASSRGASVLTGCNRQRQHSSISSQSRRTHVRCFAAAQTKVLKTPDKFIPTWRDCYGDLSAKGLRTVTATEASKLMATGQWVLLDVRRPDQHEKAHPEGAASVPMYRLIEVSKGVDFQKIVKVVAFSFNGVSPIDSNTAFVAEALAAHPGKKFITVCEAGGTMRKSVNFPLGKPSRSLQAAFKLMDEAGLTADDVVHLERGVYGWYEAGLPMVGDYTPDLGRTPMAAPEPEVANQGGGGAGAPEEKKKGGWFKF